MTRRLQINMLILMQVSNSWTESLRKEVLCKWDHVAITRFQPLQNSFLGGTRNQRSPTYRDRFVVTITDTENCTRCCLHLRTILFDVSWRKVECRIITLRLENMTEINLYSVDTCQSVCSISFFCMYFIVGLTVKLILIYSCKCHC